MATEIDQLAEFWRERYSERARGGQVSLAGYRFQLIVALRDAVQAFLRGQDTEPSVFTERISDVCQSTADNEILFTQIKRTGRTVSNALEELWTIHTLALEKLPQLLPKLRYRILCSRWTLKDISGSIDRWLPALPGNADQISAFKKRVTWATEPNPLHELLALVANELEADEPLPTVLSWIGFLSDQENGSNEIWSKLIELRNKRRRIERSRLYIWTSRECPPETVSHGDILISQQPKLEHLRRGYFAQRPLYRKIFEDIVLFISSAPKERDPALRTPVLWIGGRSGCGKSVALLHILALLHEEGIGPIIWLGNGVNFLSEAIHRASVIAGDREQPIIALDDPYAPRTQGDDQPWRNALAELEQLQNRSTVRPPILICCGPTEQARRLEEDFPDDINVHTLTIPDTLDDREQLEEWFEQRMGVPPPAVGNGDVLLVQLFFEWRTGKPLPSFAQRFRKRLEEKDPSCNMRDIVYRIIAVNRLYAGYSSAALKAHLRPEQLDAFESLLRENHFVISEDYGRRGVWMTHPHLANALFEAWLPRSLKPHERDTILKDAFLDGLRFGETPLDQTAALWALARLIRADGPIRKRVGDDGLEQFLLDLYSAWRNEQQGSLAFSHLPAWINLRLSIPELHLTPDPVDEALVRLKPDNKEETGFRLTCHKLLQNWHRLPEAKQFEVRNSLLNLLTLTQEWWEWPFVALDAVLRIDDEELRKLVESRLMSDQRVTPLALSQLLTRQHLGPNRYWLLKLTVRWIKQNYTEAQSGPLLSLLLRRRDLGSLSVSLITLALNWVQQHRPGYEGERILRRLLNIKLPHTIPASVVVRMVRLTLEYIDKLGVKESNSFLLAAILRYRVLLKAEDANLGASSLADSVIHRAMSWLELYTYSSHTPYVADRLLRLRKLPDDEWVKVATRSLILLHNEPNQRDADYTLSSISRRRDLLTRTDKSLYFDLIRDWLNRTLATINQLLAMSRIQTASKTLPPALPLAAILGDAALKQEVETIARNLRSNMDEALRKQFDTSIWKLHISHIWPNQSEGLELLHRIGIKQEEETLRHKLARLAVNGVGETDPPILEIVESTLKTIETALDTRDDKLTGLLLPSLIPIVVSLGEPHLTTTEALSKRFINSPQDTVRRQAFLRTCDRLAYNNAWSKAEEILYSLKRAGVDTPKVLELLAIAEAPPPVERVSSSLKFVLEVFHELQEPAGVFLSPLLVLCDRTKDRELLEKCHKLTADFLDSPNVVDNFKASLANLLRELAGPAISDSLRSTVETLGLQAPWLVDAARGAMPISSDKLRHYLRQADQFIDKGSLSRAGRLLPPLLFLATISGDTELWKDVSNVALRGFTHKQITHAQRDKFIDECKSYPWTDPDIQDEVFQVIGIDAPKLDQLLNDPHPSVPIELIQRSLDNTETHLRSNRLGCAQRILTPAIPLASWISDQSYLERALDLARQLLSCHTLDPWICSHFAKKSVILLQNGHWKSSEIGSQCLAELGLLNTYTEAIHDDESGNIQTEDAEGFQKDW